MASGGSEAFGSTGLGDQVITSLPWTEKEYSLDFNLFRIRLSARVFPALELDLPPCDLSSDPLAYAPDWSKAPEGTQLIVIPWQPQPVPSPVLQMGRYGIRYVSKVEERAIIDLSGDYKDYMSQFSAKERHNLNRTVKRFAERFGEGQVRWGEFSTSAEMRKWLQLAHQVAQRSWQASIGVDLPDPETPAAARLLAAAERNRVRGYLLFAGEHGVAYALCSVHRKHLVYEQVGYDPNYREWSPGTILLLKIIEKLHSAGNWRAFDLDRCTEHLSYKKHFATQCQRFERVLYFRNSHLPTVLAHIALTKFYGIFRSAGLGIGLRPAVRRLERLVWGRRAIGPQTARGAQQPPAAPSDNAAGAAMQ